MAVFLSPVGGASAQFFDNNGDPLTGGKLYSYAAGTTTPQATYTSSSGNISHTNPIVLDAAGRISGGGEVWLSTNTSYKFVLKNSDDVLIATWDNISGNGDPTFSFYTPATTSLLAPGPLTVKSALDQITNEDTGSSLIGYTASFTNAQNRTITQRLSDFVSVMDFGAVGNGIADDTAAMQAAHNTGKLVYYPKGTYNFTKITIASGGITGEGKLSILRTTDTSSDDVITYTSVDPTGILINTVGGLFQNFTLLASSATQKAAGAGIRISPANYAGSPNEDYLTICQGLYIRNLPIGISFTLSSYFTVVGCSFGFFTIAGIYTDMNNALFQDNGDNTIIGNTFYTNAATSPSGRGIWYRAGGARIIGNKINGGLIGVDINPLRGTSIAIVQGNSIENQTGNAIRGYIGNDFTTISAVDGFSFLQFVGNQIGGYNLTGPAISVDSYASDPAFYNCSISDNIIFNPVDYGARAIDIRQVKRFIVSNNFVDNSGVGYGSLFVASSSTSGLVTRNQFLRANATYNSNILNSSTTTVIDEIVSQFSQGEAVGTIAAGGKYQVGYVTKANLGDFVSASVSVDTGDCIIHSEVYALDAVRVTIYNPTASPIVVGNATIRVRVVSN